MESVFVPQAQKVIALPNKKIGRKINLRKLHDLIKGKETLNPKYDTRSNPCLNYLEINVSGSIWVYANGTAKTNLNLPDESLLLFFDKLYQAYMKECLEESK